MKVTVLVRNDHESLKAFFKNFNRVAGGRSHESKRDRFNEFRRELLIHFRMEQEIFYPALVGTASPRAATLVGRAEQDHRSIERGLRELEALSPASKAFDTRLAALIDDVTRHIAMEEEEIFGEARKSLSEYRLEELGLEMEERRKILVTLAA
jgi:iron-sulfur cluster repair protein YtfE (RIC family)